MKYSARTYILGIVAALMPLAGCTDNFLAENNEGSFATDAVGFTATVATADSRETRSETDLYEPLVLNADTEDFPLYLHTWEHPLGEGEISEPEESESAETRGLQVNTPQQLFDIHKSFAVKGDKDNGDPYIAMQNTKMINNGSYRLWTTEVPQRWPGNEKLSFNAVAPYGHQSKLDNSAFLKNSIIFDYTALKSSDGTKDAEAQIDLMMATATMNREETKDYNYRVPLNFGHALSAIKFAVRDVIKGKVVSIAIKGINSTGHCEYTADPDSKNGKFVWSSQTNKADYKQEFNYVIASDGNYDPTDESQDIVINETMPEKTFMLIPQEIPDDAVIEAVIERDNLAPGLAKTITVRGKIKANNVERWLPGYEYVYTISTSKDNWVYVFDAEGNQAEGINNIYVYSPSDPRFYQYGNNAYFNVISYRYKANDQNFIQPLPWKASHGGSLSYNVDRGVEVAYPVGNPQLKFIESSAWIDDQYATKLSGKGSSTKNAKERHNLVFQPHFVATDWIGDQDMQGYPEYSGYSESQPYDLSTFGGARSRTTANCYVVDRGGWYMFPLVYGNAIKNGSTNASSYTCQSTDATNRLQRLVDYNGNNITGPNISITNQARAEMVWQDAYGMIDESSIQIVTINGEKMIRFKVESNNLQQGNAIIALTAGDNSIGQSTVIWSWHIWATEHWLDKTTRLPHVYDQTNSNFNTYKESVAKDENGQVIGYRQAGDVAVTHMQENRTFMMSPYNIGWCDPKKVLYLKRKNDMAFVQYMPDGTAKTGLTDNIPIIQQGSVVDYKIGNNVYFQWGRKDPMRGYFNRESTYKVVFGPRIPAMEGQIGKSIKDGIQKPNILFVGDGDMNTNQDWLQNGGYKNLWNNDANVGTGSVNGGAYNANIWSHTKTVYDPSPAGYMVPNAGVWNFITKTSAPNTPTAPNHHQATGDLNWFKAELNGGWINSYNYKVYGNAPGTNQTNENALFFASTGHRWFSNIWKPGGITAGDNFGSNVYYAWSNRWINAANAHCVALGLDTDDSSLSAGQAANYFIADHFIARKAMARPVRAIREP